MNLAGEYPSRKIEAKSKSSRNEYYKCRTAVLIPSRELIFYQGDESGRREDVMLKRRECLCIHFQAIKLRTFI